MKRKVQKYPLLYSFAEQALEGELMDKDGDKNQGKNSYNKTAQDFLAYIKSIDRPYNAESDKKGGQGVQEVNEKVHNYYESDSKQKGMREESMRHMLQALSFNLTVDQACEIFPKTMNAEVPNLAPGDDHKKTGKEVYEEMLRILYES